MSGIVIGGGIQIGGGITIVFQPSPPPQPTLDITTENSDPIITQSGDIITTE